MSSTYGENGASGVHDNAGDLQNIARTCAPGGTKLTQARSGPVRYRLISPDGFPSGTYDTAQEAASAAGGFWPGAGQDETNSGFGWDIQVVQTAPL